MNRNIMLISTLVLFYILTSGYSYAVCTQQPNGTIDPMVDCVWPRAACDGATDDSAVFADAMNILNANGGTLKVPARTCLVNTTLDITRTQGSISIHCAGPDYSCMLTTTSPDIPQIKATSAYPGVRRISIRGLVFYREVTPTIG